MEAIGATVTSGGVRYRVWAPGHRRVQVAIGPEEGPQRLLDLQAAPGGYFEAADTRSRPGDLYRYIIDDGDRAPDVASRSQPLGIFGPSEVVDPAAYAWTQDGWKRPSFRGRVVYELHVGTFTPEGSFRSAIERLPYLAQLGVNTIELMPLGDFPGKRNWGYDGVMPFAPARCYGRPDDLRALVDAAHGLGLAIVIDVVYNHYGPVGNALRRFSAAYFHPREETPWGESFNFDGPDSAPVRAFFLANAVHWIDEYRVDGLRLDATHAVRDQSERHIFAEIAAAVRERGGFTIAEDERNEAAIVFGDADGWNADAVWADDFHHSVRVALTGARESYFGSFEGSPRELAEILEHGWLYRGQHFPHWNRPRGSRAAHLPPERFVWCISNHDQIGNRPLGERLAALCSPGGYRAASLLVCLAPYTPMIFMGEEWAAATPFLFFCDHPGEIGQKMAGYRRQEFESRSYRPDPETLARMPDPQAESTFLASRLRWTELGQAPHRMVLELYRTALALRAAHPLFQNPPRGAWTARAVGGLIVIRWQGDPAGAWLLLVRLREGAAEKLFDAITRPGTGRRWESVLHTDEARFGGALPEAPQAPAAAEFEYSGSAAAWLLREHLREH